MQKRLPLREAAVGVGTLAGSFWYEVLPPEILGNTDHLTQDLNTLWELSQEPEKPRSLFLFRVTFL